MPSPGPVPPHRVPDVLLPRTSRRAVLGAGAALALAARQALAAPGKPRLELGGGVNIAGGEFNPGKTRVNFEYTYPDEATIDYFARKGARLFRVPFLAERLLARGPKGLVPGPDLPAMADVVRKVGQRGGRIILDMHQYGLAFGGGLIGRDPGANESFAESWKVLAGRFRGEAHVIFGLMNEPNKQSATEWLSGANLALAAIREAGARQLVLVPGSYWDGAASWITTDNATVMTGVRDPADRFAYEAHCYLDGDNSGTHPEAIAGSGATRLAAFTEWCRQNRAKAVLGEFGWADNPQAHREGEALLAAMQASPYVWIGWTYWAAGSWWGNYMYSVQPKDGQDRPQMAVLSKFMDK